MKAKLRAIGINELNGALDKFLADFPDEATRRKFLNDELDVEVWKKFASIPGDTKTWIRKSVALQERIKAKIADGTFTSADVDKLKNYYSTHLSNSDVTTYPMTSSTGQYYDIFGHPDFTSSVKQIRKKDGTLGRASYEPSGGITGNRTTDAKLANEWAAANFDAEDFEYISGNTCKIKDPLTGNMVEHTWHHHQDGKTMMAVPTEIHAPRNASHKGGYQAKISGIVGFFDSPIF